MQHVWNYMLGNPWLLILIAGGSAIWIGSIVVIIASPKFLRKWLWFLLSLFHFGYAWGIGDNATIGISLPIGSLYILWFWRFGSPPTQEAIANRQARLAANTRPSATVAVLRTSYFAATIAVAAVAWITISGAGIRLIAEGERSNPHSTAFFVPPEIMIGMDLLAIGLVLVMLFLTIRPYWWGKVICLWAGLSWTGFAAMTPVLLKHFSAVSTAILISGIVLLVVAVVHQIVDPRFGGSYLRREAL